MNEKGSAVAETKDDSRTSNVSSSVSRKNSVGTNTGGRKGSRSALVGEEEKGPDLSHVLPHDLENDISEEDGSEAEESDSISSTEYEQDLSRKRDIAQILRNEQEPERGALSPQSNPSVSRSILSGLSTISHNRRQAHIASEQKRRQSINEGFEDLRRAVPTCSNSSDSKAVILRKAVNYINQLANEVARLKSIMGGSPMQVPAMAPPLAHHMIYPHQPSTGGAPQHMMHPSYHHPMGHIGSPMGPGGEQHGGYGAPSVGSRQSPSAMASAYPLSTSTMGSRVAHHLHPSQMHGMSQSGGMYGSGAHPLPPPPPPVMSYGSSNMSYPVGYGHMTGPGPSYGHMPNVQPRPAQQHSLPPALPHGPTSLPPLKPQDYNRDDYASAASLSMLRREPRGGGGSEEKPGN